MHGLYQEGQRITAAYGNHPSFIMMAYGNEPAGEYEAYLGTWVAYWKQRDSRRVYTSGAGWPVLPENQYHNIPAPRIQAWGAQLKSRINFGPAPLDDATIEWRLIDGSGAAVAAGVLPPATIAIGNGQRLGAIEAGLGGCSPACNYTLVVGVAGTPFENDWDIWAFADHLDAAAPDDILIAEQLEDTVLAQLGQGGKVLLMPRAEQVRTESQIGFSSIFWNTAWTNNQAPHTLGILCDPGHPAFDEFPTEQHSNWQWWELIHGAAAMTIDHLPGDLRPLVQPIDTWFENRRLGLLLEASVGGGSDNRLLRHLLADIL